MAGSTYSSRWATKVHRAAAEPPGGDSHVTPGVKKIVTWLAIAFVAFYLLNNPTEAGGVVQGIGGFFADGFEAIIQFLTSVFE